MASGGVGGGDRGGSGRPPAHVSFPISQFPEAVVPQYRDDCQAPGSMVPQAANLGMYESSAGRSGGRTAASLRRRGGATRAEGRGVRASPFALSAARSTAGGKGRRRGLGTPGQPATPQHSDFPDTHAFAESSPSLDPRAGADSESGVRSGHSGALTSLQRELDEHVKMRRLRLPVATDTPGGTAYRVATDWVPTAEGGAIVLTLDDGKFLRVDEQFVTFLLADAYNVGPVVQPPRPIPAESTAVETARYKAALRDCGNEAYEASLSGRRRAALPIPEEFRSALGPNHPPTLTARFGQNACRLIQDDPISIHVAATCGIDAEELEARVLPIDMTLDDSAGPIPAAVIRAEIQAGVKPAPHPFDSAVPLDSDGAPMKIANYKPTPPYRLAMRRLRRCADDDPFDLAGLKHKYPELGDLTTVQRQLRLYHNDMVVSRQVPVCFRWTIPNALFLHLVMPQAATAKWKTHRKRAAEGRVEKGAAFFPPTANALFKDIFSLHNPACSVTFDDTMSGTLSSPLKSRAGDPELCWAHTTGSCSDPKCNLKYFFIIKENMAKAGNKHRDATLCVVVQSNQFFPVHSAADIVARQPRVPRSLEWVPEADESDLVEELAAQADSAGYSVLAEAIRSALARGDASPDDGEVEPEPACKERPKLKARRRLPMSALSEQRVDAALLAGRGPKSIARELASEMPTQRFLLRSFGGVPTEQAIRQRSYRQRAGRAPATVRTTLSRLEMAFRTTTGDVPTPGYIRVVSDDPVGVFLQSQAEIDFIKGACVTGRETLHIDTTGNIVKDLLKNTNTHVTVFVLVLHHPGTDVTHSTVVGHWLAVNKSYESTLCGFRAFVSQLRRAAPDCPLPRVVVTDSEWSLRKSVMSTFDGMTVVQYVQVISDIVQRKVPLNVIRRLTISRVCVAHFVALVKRALEKACKDGTMLGRSAPAKQRRDLFLLSICALFECTKTAAFKELYQTMLVVFTEPWLYTFVQSSVELLQTTVTQYELPSNVGSGGAIPSGGLTARYGPWHFVETTRPATAPTGGRKNTSQRVTIKSQCGFWKETRAEASNYTASLAADNAVEIAENEKEVKRGRARALVNALEMTWAMDKLLDQWLPYCLFWSSLLTTPERYANDLSEVQRQALDESVPSRAGLSNAPAESYIGKLKGDWLTAAQSHGRLLSLPRFASTIFPEVRRSAQLTTTALASELSSVTSSAANVMPAHGVPRQEGAREPPTFPLDDGPPPFHPDPPSPPQDDDGDEPSEGDGSRGGDDGGDDDEHGSKKRGDVEGEVDDGVVCDGDGAAEPVDASVEDTSSMDATGAGDGGASDEVVVEAPAATKPRRARKKKPPPARFLQLSPAAPVPSGRRGVFVPPMRTEPATAPTTASSGRAAPTPDVAATADGARGLPAATAPTTASSGRAAPTPYVAADGARARPAATAATTASSGRAEPTADGARARPSSIPTQWQLLMGGLPANRRDKWHAMVTRSQCRPSACHVQCNEGLKLWRRQSATSTGQPDEVDGLRLDYLELPECPSDDSHFGIRAKRPTEDRRLASYGLDAVRVPKKKSRPAPIAKGVTVVLIGDEESVDSDFDSVRGWQGGNGAQSHPTAEQSHPTATADGDQASSTSASAIGRAPLGSDPTQPAAEPTQPAAESAGASRCRVPDDDDGLRVEPEDDEGPGLWARDGRTKEERVQAADRRPNQYRFKRGKDAPLAAVRVTRAFLSKTGLSLGDFGEESDGGGGRDSRRRPTATARGKTKGGRGGASSARDRSPPPSPVPSEHGQSTAADGNGGHGSRRRPIATARGKKKGGRGGASSARDRSPPPSPVPLVHGQSASHEPSGRTPPDPPPPPPSRSDTPCGPADFYVTSASSQSDAESEMRQYGVFVHLAHRGERCVDAGLRSTPGVPLQSGTRLPWYREANRMMRTAAGLHKVAPTTGVLVEGSELTSDEVKAIKTPGACLLEATVDRFQSRLVNHFDHVRGGQLVQTASVGYNASRNLDDRRQLIQLLHMRSLQGVGHYYLIASEMGDESCSRVFVYDSLNSRTATPSTQLFDGIGAAARTKTADRAVHVSLPSVTQQEPASNTCGMLACIFGWLLCTGRNPAFEKITSDERLLRKCFLDCLRKNDFGCLREAIFEYNENHGGSTRPIPLVRLYLSTTDYQKAQDDNTVDEGGQDEFVVPCQCFLSCSRPTCIDDARHSNAVCFVCRTAFHDRCLLGVPSDCMLAVSGIASSAVNECTGLFCCPKCIILSKHLSNVDDLPNLLRDQIPEVINDGSSEMVVQYGRLVARCFADSAVDVDGRLPFGLADALWTKVLSALSTPEDATIAAASNEQDRQVLQCRQFVVPHSRNGVEMLIRVIPRRSLVEFYAPGLDGAALREASEKSLTAMARLLLAADCQPADGPWRFYTFDLDIFTGHKFSAHYCCILLKCFGHGTAPYFLDKDGPCDKYWLRSVVNDLKYGCIMPACDAQVPKIFIW